SRAGGGGAHRAPRGSGRSTPTACTSSTPTPAARSAPAAARWRWPRRFREAAYSLWMRPILGRAGELDRVFAFLDDGTPSARALVLDGEAGGGETAIRHPGRPHAPHRGPPP